LVGLKKIRKKEFRQFRENGEKQQNRKKKKKKWFMRFFFSGTRSRLLQLIKLPNN